MEENKKIYYDKDLKLEVLSFKGKVQGFPNHFHDYYVIGFVSDGSRNMICNNKEYHLISGDLIIFNPNDTHACINEVGENFDYSAINISKETMKNLYSDEKLPVFSSNVIRNRDISDTFNSLYNKIINNSDMFDKEETLVLFLNMLKDYLVNKENERISEETQIKFATDFIDKNFYKHITLDELCKISAMSKTTLIRYFTKIKGVTPYRYLQSVRINYAKSLLENGKSPIEVSMSAGFSDQSHFTNSFINHIGLTPSNYRNIFKENKYEK